MPTYTAPTTRTTGELITAAVYNTDLVENIKFFKDAPTFDGAVTASTTLAVGTGLTYTTSVKSTTALVTPGALSATQATAFASTVSGAAIMGFGTTNDVSLMNRAGTVVLGIGPNTTAVNIPGTLAVTGAVTGGTYNSQTISSAANLTGTLAVGGLLTVSGFGTHIFSAGGTGGNIFRVRNTTAGISNYAAHYIGNDNNTDLYAVESYSSTLTSAGPAFASGVGLAASGAGGLSILASHASGAIRFYSGGLTNWLKLGTSGKLCLGTDLTEYGRLNVANTTSQDLLFLKFTNTPATASQFITFLNSAGTTAGYVSMVAGDASVNYSTTSDARMKRDLGIVTDSSEILRNTLVHDFIWRTDGKSRGRNVFAQEVHKILPRAVAIPRADNRLDENGLPMNPWGVDKSEYVPELIVGWQQHDATIQSLTARIAALEAGA